MYANKIGILPIQLSKLLFKGHPDGKKNPHVPYTTHSIPPLFRLTQNTANSVMNLLILSPYEPLAFRMVVALFN
jgi:hypothetical protein